MNFLKTAIAGAVIAASTIFAPSVEAAPSTCWINGDAYTDAMPLKCDVTRRINYNRHIVWDVDDYQGTKFTVVLWKNGTAEVIFPNGVIRYWDYRQDSDGDAYLTDSKGNVFAFRFTS